MRPARGKSNPKAPLPSQQLEFETKKMEEKLAFLKAQMEVEKKKKEESFRTSGSRWKTSTGAQPIKNYANAIIDAKKQTEQVKKIDYAKLNKEYGEQMKQKSSLKNTSSSISSVKRPTSNSQTSRQKENQSSSDLNKSLNGSFSQSSSKGMLERRNSRDGKQIKQAVKAVLTPYLKSFLEEMNITKFTDAFLNNGLATEESITQLTNDQLTKMGIPPGFQIKIMKKVNSLKENQPNVSQNEPVKLESQIKKTSLTNLTPQGKIQRPIVEDLKKGTQEQETNSPNPLQQADSNKNPSKPPLLKKQASQDLKKVRFQDKSPQIQPKIKQTNDNSGKQLFHTESTATDAQTPSDFLLKKISCWQCYSIFPEENSLFQYGKNFCKQDCLNTYEEYYIVQCFSKNCQKKVCKQESSFREGQWYCIGKCEPNIKEIEEMWEQQMQPGEQQDGESDEQYYERKIKEFENIDRRKKEEYDLKLSSETDKKQKVLTLEEIEAKYKLINEEQNIN